jgi:hypothetical protein
MAETEIRNMTTEHQDDVSDDSIESLASQLALTVARWRIGNLEKRIREKEAEQEWQTMETAPRENSTEFLGCNYVEGRMVREPFVSFWSPTLNKFFGSPNYWVPIPKLPAPKGSDS